MRSEFMLLGFVAFLPMLLNDSARLLDVPPFVGATADGSVTGNVATIQRAELPRTGTSAAVAEVAPDTASVAWRVEAAVAALSPHVVVQSHPEALRIAVAAYYRFADSNPERVRNPYFYFVDFGLDNLTPRGYVFDMSSLDVVEGPFTVSHGRGSLAADGVPTRFSNQPGSYSTSLGLYVTRETYTFRGRASGRAYRSVGLRLDGVSGSFNNNALRRGIVVHGAPYVTSRRAGLSEGCPAMEQERASRLLPMIANGGLVFHFSPNDERWLAQVRWESPVAAAD